MSPQSLKFSAIVPPNTTTILTAQIDHKATTLLNINWLHFDGVPATTFAAWLTNDAINPTYDDPGNNIITKRTTFPDLIKNLNRETLHPCKPIPAHKWTLAVELINPSLIAQHNASMTYDLV